MFIPTDQPVDVSKLSSTGRHLYDIKEQILQKWLDVIRNEIAQATEVSEPILVDTIPTFLDNLAEALSPGMPRQDAVEGSNVAQAHGNERARLTNYQPAQLVHEYQLLRKIIFGELCEEKPLSADEKEIIFNSLDKAIRMAITQFAEVQTSIREQFIATLTHDLRNPLGVAQMAIEGIVWEPRSEDVPMLAQKADENLERVNAMIQDLLDATYVKAGGQLTLDLSEFDMEEVVSILLRRMTLTHGSRFTSQLESVKGSWDRSKIERILSNLLVNALKYGSPEAPIAVVLVSHHNRVNLSVHNEGNPIPKDEQEVIFQAFRRSHSDRQKPQGWGLGLASVKGVAEAHGGTVHLDSSVERGTTFIIDLPIDTREVLTKTPAPRGSPKH